MPYNFSESSLFGMPAGFSYQDFQNRLPKNVRDALTNLQRLHGGTPLNDLYYQYQSQAQGKPEGNFYNTELPDPTPYYDAGGLNKLFDIARGNLGQQQASTAANAARRAGALSSGFLNPGGFVNMATNQATAPYAQQFGQLEMGRAGALSQLQQLLYQMLAQKAAAERGGEDAQRAYYLQLQQLAEQRRQFNEQMQANTPSFWDYFLGAIPGIGSIFSIPGIFGSNSSSGTGAKVPPRAAGWKGF